MKTLSVVLLALTAGMVVDQVLGGNFETRDLIIESLGRILFAGGLTAFSIWNLIVSIKRKMGLEARVNEYKEILFSYGISLDEEVAKSRVK